MRNTDILIESLIQQGVITQEEFDKKVEEYSVPVNKQKDILNLVKPDTVKYEEVSSNPDSDIEEVREAKINELKQLCSEAVYKGFYSDTMDCSFGFNERDQSNFSQQILLQIMSEGAEEVVWKTQEGSVIELTNDQFMKVVAEAKNHKLSNQATFWSLEVSVLAATTIEEIKSITW